MEDPLNSPVVCLDTQNEISAYATRCLGHRNGAILVRCPAILSEVLNLGRRIGPATLLTSEAFLSHLSPSSIRDLSSMGKLWILVVLKSKQNDGLLMPYFREGCSGVLYLDDSPEVWQKAIPTVAAGELWAPRRILSQLVREMTHLPSDSSRKITPRESEILEMIGKGYDNKHIANELFISKETVRWHVRSLYSKIGVPDRDSAIRFWRLNQRNGSRQQSSGSERVSSPGAELA